jgi:3'(2'), 5'-bisphosphate nucleotidase
MRQEDYRLLLDALLPSVLAAGRIEMAHFKAGVTVETKADTTPVTIADHEAEELLTEGLHRAAPGVPVIAEEAVAAGRVPESRS